jgi:hypothetical protein
MYDKNELLFSASVEEIMQGYIYDKKSQQYTCLVCGKSFTSGVIYPEDGILLQACMAVNTHISREHISMFEYLLNLDKKLTGLTDLQKNLLHHFYQGCSDNETAASIDAGSTSTVRNHRFALRQREKQAKVFLSLMGLMEKSKTHRKNNFINPGRDIMIYKDYTITEDETQKVIKIYFKEGPDGPLDSFPTKEKRKIVILKQLIGRFEPGWKYTEAEVNEILQDAYSDYVTLRRYLIEYGFLERYPDGSRYWVKSNNGVDIEGEKENGRTIDNE